MPVHYYQEIDDDAGGAPLRREISIDTASDAVTLPDNPGAGHTLDKAMVWGGERLERAVTWVFSRVGRGPTSSIKEIMQAVYKSSMRPRACPAELRRCGYWGPPGAIAAPPTTYELPVVCDWLAYAAYAPRCPECGVRMTEQDIRTPVKSSKKLVKLISASNKSSGYNKSSRYNKSSCYISLQLLTLLVTMFPGSREVFTGLGALDVIHGVSQKMSDQLDMDPLLASSRRALMSLADAEILSLGKELEVMVAMADLHNSRPVISKLIHSFSHPEKMFLALTIAHRFPRLLDARSSPVLNTIYPMLLSRLISSSDQVEVAVLTDSLYRIIDAGYELSPWLIPTIKTRPQLPYRIRCAINGLEERYEKEASALEPFMGRRVNYWRKAIWLYNPDDPEAEPNDAKFYKMAVRDDDKPWYAKIDAVWWEAPVWETCARRKCRLEGREEDGTEDGERRGRDDHPSRGRRPRAQSMTITVWPDWMRERLRGEAVEWREYWKKVESVNFTGWPRKVGIWLKMEHEPESRRSNMPWRDHDWAIYWIKLSTRMRSRSVD